MFVKAIVLTTGLLFLASFLRRAPRVAAALGLLTLAAGCASPPSIDGPVDRVAENLDRGRSAVASGKMGEATPPLAAACVTEQGCREALPLLLEAYARSKQDDAAVLLFAAIAERHPSLRPEALASKGFFLERTHDLDAAREAYSAALEELPTAPLYERLGRLLARMQHLDESVAALETGLGHFAEHRDLRLALGRTLRERGDHTEAERVLTSLVGEEPDLAPAWAQLGWARLARGDTSGAEEALRHALRVEDPSNEARYLFAKLALLRRDDRAFEEIVKEIRRPAR